MALALLPFLPSCQSADISGNGLFISEETTGPDELLLTVRIGTRVTATGMRVDTVGEDTVITRIEDDRARRFILAGLKGYRGRIGLGFVDLVFGDTSVWIDEHGVKVHGPAGSIDVALRGENNGPDRFDGGDLIVRGDQIEPVAGSTESR